MARVTKSGSLLALVALLAGCTPGPNDPAADAGSGSAGADASRATSDARTGLDAGPAPDSGQDAGWIADAGVSDAGHDAGFDGGAFETPTPLRLVGWSPLVQVEALGEDAIDFVIDTGSPVTVLDSDYYRGTPGVLDVDFEMFGAVYPLAGAVRFNVFGSPPPGARLLVGGILGSDALIGRALTIDYQGTAGYLFDNLSGDPQVDADVGTSTVTPFRLLGGGRFNVPGDGWTQLPATRLIVAGEIEGRGVEMLVDTGATHTILDEALFRSLGDAARPALRGMSFGGAFSTNDGTLSRVARLRVGGAGIDGAIAAVIPGTNFFAAIRRETGSDVRALLGGSWLRYFLVTLDYPGRQIRLARFTASSHVNEREWIGPGFKLGSGPSGHFTVADVYTGTDAEDKGVQQGDRIAEIDGMPAGGFDLDEARTLVTTFMVGTLVDFGFRDANGQIQTLAVEIEDLLPGYP